MRVAYFSHMADINGPARTLRPRLRFLASSGRLHVAVPAAGAVAEFFSDIAEVAELPYRPLRVPATGADAIELATARRAELRALRAYIRAADPQLVVVASTTLLVPLLAARRESRPAISYCGELFNTTTAPRRAAVGLFLSAIARLSAEVVCCSKLVAAQFDRVHAQNAHVIYPGLEPAAWSETDAASARASFGLSPEGPVVASLGTLSPGRGQDLVIQALPRLQQAFPRLTYLAVGRPNPYDRHDELQRLTALANRLGVRSSVRLVDHTTSPTEVFAAADVVVNPARFPEPFGRVAIEALAYGRPVVAADVGAAREVLCHERTALLVDRDDVGDLERAIVRVLTDARLRERLVREGREEVARRFSEAGATAAFARLANAAARNGGRN